MSTPYHQLFHPAHTSDYLSTMQAGIAHLAEQLSRVDGPATGASPAAAAAEIADIDLDAPAAEGLDGVLRELSRIYLDDAVWFHEPTYAAHLNCPVLIPALLGELFISAVNSSLDTFDQSVGATFVERRLIDWTARRIGFPDGTAGGEETDGIFTSGGTQSNLQALVLARGEALAQGADAARLRIFASVDGHFSVQKAARLLGLSANSVEVVPVDRERRIDVAALRRAVVGCLADGDVPMAVVATAGTTDFGAIDPLDRIADLCREHGVWFHVDAAYGGGLLCSRRRRGWLAGIERADSVTVDFHKTFFQPVSASAVVVRRRESMRHVSWYADYLNPRTATQPNQVDKSMQTTRRFDALKLWLTLRLAGADQVGEFFDTAIDLAHDVHAALRERPGIEVVGAPGLSTVVFRIVRPGLDRARISELNVRAREALYTQGGGMVAGTRHDGASWLKFTLLNPMASREDLLGIVDRLEQLSDDLLAESEVA